MKKLIVLIIITVIGNTAIAQVQNEIPKIVPPEDQVTNNYDYYLMKDGKIWMVIGDSLRILNIEIKLGDESIIKPIGMITTKTGQNIELAEGDRVYVTGRIVKAAKIERR